MRYDKKKSGRGLSMTADFRFLNKGDRLEPTATFPDVGASFFSECVPGCFVVLAGCQGVINKTPKPIIQSRQWYHAKAVLNCGFATRIVFRSY